MIYLRNPKSLDRPRWLLTLDHTKNRLDKIICMMSNLCYPVSRFDISLRPYQNHSKGLKMPTTTKKPTFRTALQEFCGEHFQTEYSKLSDNQRHEGLIRFYLLQVYIPIKGDIDPDEIDAGIVDQPNDVGIDFIYRDNGQVLIIQAKNRASNTNEKPDPILSLQNIITRIHPDHGKDFKKARQLTDLVSEIEFDQEEDSANRL